MMRLPKFQYVSARSVDEAIARMHAAGPEGAFVAGGTDLYPNMKRRQQTPGVVVDVMRLRALRERGGAPERGVTVGAGQTLSELCRDPVLKQHYPALVQAMSVISTPLLRNMGTIGGNVLLDTRCNYYDQNFEWRKGVNFCMKKDGDVCWVAPSSPRCWAVQSSDTVPLLMALGAEFVLASAAGERRVNARDFYRDDGIVFTGKRPEELLTRIVLPPADGSWRATYRKLRRRGSFDFPVLGVAAAVWLDSDRTVRDAKIVLGAVGSAPLEASAAQDLIRGHRLEPDVIAAAADAAYTPAKPLDNTDFAYAWRKQMVRKFVRESLGEMAGS